MTLAITGLHHVTAVSSDARRNFAFYTRVLGLRLVKCTVNFEDENTCHLYYGDAEASPGSLLTFFVQPHARRGAVGRGQATAVRLAAPAEALPAWERWLAGADVTARRVSDRPGEPRLAFRDPEGLPLEIVGIEAEAEPPARAAGAPSTLAVQGMELSVSALGPTRECLRGVLGLEEGPGGRFASAGGRPVVVDVRAEPDRPPGTPGAGTVHHVALRMAGDETQIAWQEHLRRAAVEVTAVKDRTYFRSIYFWEPGGTKLELATDAPGFTVDEAPGELGTRLQLPAAFEPRRDALERRFAPTRLLDVEPTA